MAKMIEILAVFFAVTALSTFSAGDVLVIRPKVPELLLKDGAAQDLECSVNTSEKAAKLKWAVPDDEGVERLEQTEISGNTYKLHHSVKISSFDPKKHAGEYRCILTKNGREDTESKIILNSVAENKTEPVFVFKSPQASLSCNIDLAGTGKTVETMEWLKGEEKVSDLKEKDRFKELKDNNTLVIEKPDRDDAGLYIARFKIQNMPDYDCEVQFLAGPLVLDFEKSKNLIQGDNMELHCMVKGYPPAVVTWLKDGKPLNISDAENSRIQQSNLHGYPNAKLKIKSVEFEDAGKYTCEAHSVFFNETASKEIRVRVKDKLAALWPFLGIVGEVVVLCTIIFIYEKRRNKRAEQEENAAQEVDGASADKKEGLRHRNTNNPTA